MFDWAFSMNRKSIFCVGVNNAQTLKLYVFTLYTVMIKGDYVEYVFDLQNIKGENVINLFNDRIGKILVNMGLHYEIEEVKNDEDDNKSDTAEKSIKELEKITGGGRPFKKTFPYRGFDSFVNALLSAKTQISEERENSFRDLFKNINEEAYINKTSENFTKQMVNETAKENGIYYDIANKVPKVDDTDNVKGVHPESANGVLSNAYRDEKSKGDNLGTPGKQKESVLGETPIANASSATLGETGKEKMPTVNLNGYLETIKNYFRRPEAKEPEYILEKSLEQKTNSNDNIEVDANDEEEIKKEYVVHGKTEIITIKLIIQNKTRKVFLEKIKKGREPSSAP